MKKDVDKNTKRLKSKEKEKEEVSGGVMFKAGNE